MSVTNALVDALSQFSKQTPSQANWDFGYSVQDAAQQADAHDTSLIPGLAGLYGDSSTASHQHGEGGLDFGTLAAPPGSANVGVAPGQHQQPSNLGAVNSSTPAASTSANVQGQTAQPSSTAQSSAGVPAAANLSGPAASHHSRISGHHHLHHQQHSQHHYMLPLAPGGMQAPTQLPNSITVMPATDPMQAAGLINFTFTQSHHTFFLLNCRADGGITGLPVLNAALNVVLSARKISQQAMARFDLGFVPFLVTEAAESVGLLIYKCTLNPDLAKARGQVLKMEATSNPLVAGLSLFNMLQSPQQLEVIFTADAARVALQALAIMRINLANNGRDVLLLASTIDYAADATGPKSYCLLKLTPISPPLPCFQHQIDMPKPQIFAGEPALLGRYGGPRQPQYDQGAGRMHGPGARGPLSHGGPMLGATAPAAALQQKSRARKADYVIVTEDTAIKNAAGAVAKVLGRVSTQGQCCPVYTEKKTESFTTVISVAVKAIAVARGYVCNEGMGHEVGFQPYLRNLDKRMDLLDLHQYMLEKKMMHFSKSGVQPGMTGVKGLEQLEFNLDEDSLSDERCELAFDVYKIQHMPEPQDAGNLPVKVTAHSRPNVVSNIISKLVSERDGAVLITAGGKAMHVAMTAVVSARARLKAKGIDVLLLPKFVTVDTTSTLGWESVFLRFNIVRWGPALVSTADTALAASGVTTTLQDSFAKRFGTMTLTPTVG